MRRHWLITIPVAAAVATCAYQPPPLPVAGDRETLGFLAGEWTGTYASDETQRHGDIYFRLQAGSDTAHGEVLMSPREAAMVSMAPVNQPSAPPVVRPPAVLRIEFVRGSGPWVNGALEEYYDPDCDCRLKTTFNGRIDRDRIEGQFQRRHVDSERVEVGQWSVRRSGPPVERSEFDPFVSDPDSLPGLQGPTTAQLEAHGQALYQDLGCAYCHDAGRRESLGPDLTETVRHQSFSWMFHMMTNPDSMVRHDPVARRVRENYGFEMPGRAVSPWEALVLYEYLISEVRGPP